MLRKDESMKKKGSSFLFNFVTYGKEISGFSSGTMRHPIISAIGRFAGGLVKSLLYTSTKVYGYFLESFGVVSLLLHLAKYYFEDNPDVRLSTLIISAVLALVAIPLIFIDRPLCITLQDFSFTDYLLFEFFSIKRMRGEEDSVKTLHTPVGIILGLIPAIFAFFFPIESVLLIMAAILVATVSIVSPEFLFILIVLAIPYVRFLPYGELTLVGAVLLLLLSFFRKVMLGKRVMMVGITDLFVLLFVLSIVACGVIGGGGESTRESAIIAVLALGYFPAANIIVNRRLADCSANAFVIAALPISVAAFVEFLLSCISGAPTPTSSVMDEPYQLAAFLLAAMAVCIYYIAVGKRVTKIIYSVILVLLFAGLFATWCAPVLIVLALSVVAYLLIKHTDLPREILAVVCALPLLIFLLPPDILYGVSSFFKMEIPLGEMKGRLVGSFGLFLENMLVGLGADAAITVDGEVNYFNLLLGVGCRFGVVSLVSFVLLFLFELRRVSVYSRYLKSSSLGALSSFTLIAVFAVFSLGLFYDVTAATELYLVIFVLLGMNTASLRVSKKDYDDMLGYFGDHKSSNSSSLNITLKK